MQIQIAAAKIGKYATGESGDTLEMIERPHGGLSMVLVDGQRSGKAAKAISNLVARKAISLLGEGVRDGAAARAAHDYLYAHRGGKVSATLNIVSIDMSTKTLVISRNSHCPTIIQLSPEEQVVLDEDTPPVGFHRSVRPQIQEFPLKNGVVAVVFTDGITSAGERIGKKLNLPEYITECYQRNVGWESVAQSIADDLLNDALELDENRPQDDMSVLVVAVVGREGDKIRRMQVSFPIPPKDRP